jgi:hypothetical protein
VLVWGATICAAAAFVGAASGAPGMFIGVTDDSLKATPAETSAIAQDLGLKAYTLTLRWTPGESALSASAAGALGTATRAAGGNRVVLAVYGEIAPAPPEWRDHYCSYVRDAIARFPQINDVVIWNEPNLTFFWSPQYDGTASVAPQQYEALLENCYDVLHGFRPNVNVIAPATSPWGNDDPFAQSNISHAPTSFLLQLGRAYRASGRTRPIFDTLGHHPHPTSSNERPWLEHPDARFVSIGDLNRLVDTVTEAFGGTAQRTPATGLPIWYLETGYQTVPDAAKSGLYSGVENWPGTLPDDVGGEPDEPRPAANSAAPDQATQLRDSLRLLYCQPYVQAVFNFQLRDERDLGGWQSGVLWADGTPKDSYAAFRAAVAEVNTRSVNCGTLKGGTAGGVSKGFSTPAGTATTQTARQGKQDNRTPTRVVWAARHPAAFGYAELAARLLSGKRPLAGRQVTFAFAGSLIVTTTGKNGVARAPVAQPLPPGAHVVTVSYRGSPTLGTSGVKVLLRVRNSRATVATVSALRQTASVRGGFRVSSNGRVVSGSLQLRAGGRLIRTRRLNALGVAGNRRSAWFAGVTRDGVRLVGKVERTAGTGGDVLRLWLGGRPLRAVRGLDIRVLRRS